VTHESQDSRPADLLSRRTILALAGAATVAAMVGCDKNNKGLVGNLPDPLAPYSPRTMAPAVGTNVPPTLPVPPNSPITPTTPSQAAAFGIIPRSAWAKAGPDMKRVDPMGTVGLITFHHSGDPKAFLINDYAETAAHLEGVRAYHRSRNFQDIGYHFAIDRMGRIWQLRPLAYEGQHVRYNNEHNVGVVVLGNFDIQAPTAVQKEKVKSFGLLLRKQYGLPISKVKTHQEIVSTECPGDGMQPYMIQVRKAGLI